MATAVSVTYKAQCTVVETLGAELAPAAAEAARRVTHTLYDWGGTLNASSGTPATDVATFEVTLSSGTATIDLTALVHEGRTIDGTGKKVQILKVKGDSANANPITLVPGASNGYEWDGVADSKIVVSADDFYMIYKKDRAPDIAAGAKTIDVSGTGSQKVQVQIVLG